MSVGKLIADLVAPNDRKAMHFIDVDRLERLQAIEAAAKRIAAAHRELADAYHAMDKLVGR